MADNVTILDSGGNPIPVAADDLGSVWFQKVKVVWGPDGTANETDVATGKPLPVQLRSSTGIDFVKAEDAASASGDFGVPPLAVRKAVPVNTSDTDGDYEPPQISSGHLWVAPPPVDKISASFNRPADTTAYAANDGVSNNTAAGSVTKIQWTMPRSAGIIRRVRIRKSDQAVATPTLRLWLWDATFTVATGDNAAFSNPVADSIGVVDVQVINAGSDDAVGWTNCDIPFEAATLFGLLQTLSVFTPANAETFTIDLWHLPG